MKIKTGFLLKPNAEKIVIFPFGSLKPVEYQQAIELNP